MFVHLTKDLDVAPVDWLTSDDPSPVKKPELWAGYGVLKEVQRLLAAVRTDLDSFTDAESYALMTSGYLMTARELEVDRVIEGVPEPAVPQPKPNWRFLAVKEILEKADDDPKSAYQSFLKQLRVAGSLAFKVWRLRRGLQVCAAALALVALGLASYGIWWVLITPEVRNAPLATYGQIVKGFLTMLLTLLATLALGKTLMMFVQYKKTLARALVHIGMRIFGFAVARLHVHVFDRMYLAVGRVRQKPTVFLCYTRGDEQFVGALDEELRRQGHRTAIDGRDSLYAPEREKDIRGLIDAAAAFIFVASEKSVARNEERCHALVTYATDRGKKIVHVLTPSVTADALRVHGPHHRVVSFGTNSGALDKEAMAVLRGALGALVP